MATVAPTRVRSGRGVELVLLVVALVVAVAGYALVGIGVEGSAPANVVRYGVSMAVLAVVAHLVVRWRAPYADPVILPTVVALNGIGLAMIYRLNVDLADKQLMWSALSVILALVVLVLLRDHRTLRRYSYTAMLASLVLLLLPMLPIIGKEINGARIWIGVGPASFQPGEMAKIGLAVFFAGYLVTNRDTLTLAGPTVLWMKLPRARDLGPILLFWAATMVVLVAQKDMGTAVLLFGMFVGAIYLATERVSWVLLGGALLAAGAWLLFVVPVTARRLSHISRRVEGWQNALDPAVYEKGSSYQLLEGKFGMASGGLFGTGLGQGHPYRIPFAYSDSIVASLGEELGLTGLVAVLVLITILVQRGMRTALGVRDGFGKLLAGGLSFLIALQTFVVVGGVTGLIPLTGLTAPFLAHGGSSLLGNWLIVGLLLRISDDARRPAPAVPVLPTPSGGIPVLDRPSADSAIVVAGSGVQDAPQPGPSGEGVAEVVPGNGASP
ncbi:MAG: FtsW/RodA/SpoVE family cell cycle protein [Micrococcales bacterium]|nr:FtsW/RodA/SpoVE family cell cycle protein [Micrococcales bacterium]